MILSLLTWSAVILHFEINRCSAEDWQDDYNSEDKVIVKKD